MTSQDGKWYYHKAVEQVLWTLCFKRGAAFTFHPKKIPEMTPVIIAAAVTIVRVPDVLLLR